MSTELLVCICSRCGEGLKAKGDTMPVVYLEKTKRLQAFFSHSAMLTAAEKRGWMLTSLEHLCADCLEAMIEIEVEELSEFTPDQAKALLSRCNHDLPQYKGDGIYECVECGQVGHLDSFIPEFFEDF